MMKFIKCVLLAISLSMGIVTCSQAAICMTRNPGCPTVEAIKSVKLVYPLNTSPLNTQNSWLVLNDDLDDLCTSGGSEGNSWMVWIEDISASTESSAKQEAQSLLQRVSAPMTVSPDENRRCEYAIAGSDKVVWALAP